MRLPTSSSDRRGNPGSAATFVLVLLLAGTWIPAGQDQPGVQTLDDHTSDPVSQRVSELAREGAYQTELPGRDDPSSRVSFTLPYGLAVLVRLLIWGLGVAVVVLGLVFLGQRLWKESSADDTSRTAATGRWAAPEKLPDPVALAASGRYDLALHALLGKAIVVLHRRSRTRITLSDSLTSRELMILLPLDGSGRAAFSNLVRSVEQSYFGGREIASEQFDEGRKQYRLCTGETL